MPLTTLSRIKALAGIPASDTTQDAVVQAVLASAEGAVKSWCKRNLEQKVYTEYMDGTGTPNLIVRERPVRLYTLAGTLTSGSAVVTGLSSTANLLAGMPAVHASIPVGATISTIDSATQVTLSANATASGSATIHFGLALWSDSAGFYGDATDSFSDSRQHLNLGIDFALRRDDEDGTACKSGVIVRLAGGSTAGQGIADWYWGGGTRKGTLTARMPPVWPKGYGNLKIVYAAGYATIPDDLALAVDQLAVWSWRTAPQGGMAVTSEGYEGYSYSLSQLTSDPALGTTRQILTRYRELAV